MTRLLSDLRGIAVALGGEVSGRQVLAPGPGHGPRDRSLSVHIAPDAPDGFVAFSHAGDDWKECRDYIRQRLGLERHAERPAARPRPQPAGEVPPDTRINDALQSLA